MRKTTARIVTSLTVVAVCLSVCPLLAGPFRVVDEAALGVAVTAQTASSNDQVAGKRENVDDLLRRARQAMAEGDLQAADSLISRAEALGIQYSPLSFGDTPKRARHDLERKLQAAGNASNRSGQRLPGLPFGAKKPSATDPFATNAGKAVASAGGASASAVGSDTSLKTMTLPSVDQAAPLLPFSSREVQQPRPGVVYPMRAAPASQSNSDRRSRADALLLDARLALAQGDVRRAAGFVQEAKAIEIPYGFQEDSPDKVQTAIDKYQELMSQGSDGPKTEAFRRHYSRLMMEQGDALLRWKQYDEAERLANQAADQHVIYSPFEATPQGLLKRIAIARRGDDKGVSGATSGGAVGGLAIAEGGAPAPSLAAKQKVSRMTLQARAAMSAGYLDQAEMLAREALRIGVPDSAFGQNEDRPGLVLLEIQAARAGQPVSPVVQAGGRAGVSGPVAQAQYTQEKDRTRNVPASNVEAAGSDDRQPFHFAQDSAVPGASPTSTQPERVDLPVAESQNAGMVLFQQGLEAMRAHQTDRALRLFQQAAAYRDQMDPLTAQRLQDHLQLLSGGAAARPPAEMGPRSIADAAAAEQQMLARQVSADLAQQERQAAALRERDPKAALAILEQARQKVSVTGLEPAAREQLLRRVDRSLAEMHEFLEQNRSRIELEEKNQQVRQGVEHEQKVKLEIQEKLALMVDEFNRLMDDQRFAQAEVVAKRAKELDPENPVVIQLEKQAKFTRHIMNNFAVRDAKEAGFMDVLAGVDEASTPFDADSHPLVFPNPQRWEDLTKTRARWLAEQGQHRSERELEIHQKLKTPVSLQFKDRPLSEVLDYLARLAQVNLHLDPQGLQEEGVASDTPVTINLSQEISLKSALNLILQPLHLTYIIKDEVLKITSEQRRNGEVYPRTYCVADLVVPIPNFVPGPNIGLQGALHDAYGSVGFGGFGPFGSGPSPISVVASKDGRNASGAINPSVLAQMNRPGSTSSTASSIPATMGPGGLGGGAQADFDSLIDLITTTVQPETWQDVGGPGSIAPFETNLSLVVSQTQDVHEEIVELLNQLRRLQDLQVTIEVRFITLNDNFFERIGVDFDFDINDKIDRPYQLFGRTDPAAAPVYSTTPTANTGPARDVEDQDYDRSVVVGMQAPGIFSADLDIPFRQGSYALAVPQFGGFDPTAGASVGFAILSDIEAFFFINAAQGDRRTNVLQAPKVTLFNGQMASVMDFTSRPFVMSVIPVVGDFAAAQQPVIVVLSEGTFLTVQAVVSDDRRFVRLTVVPFFSQIGEVDTFTFDGQETSTTSTSNEGKVDPQQGDPTKTSDTTTTVHQGTTVQLPSFSVISVMTTVSVPDGGTILLGGIKRLNEGRNEFGVPMLDKLPYVNRLFKNVGIGRETQSLMMTVTPRIIIQEEEEENLGIQP